MNIAFLTSIKAPKNPDDVLASTRLEATGRYQVDFVPWDSAADWSRYEAAVIRSTWDYTERVQEFLQTLKTIEASRCKLLNSSTVVSMNYHKGYLKYFGALGLPVVPTVLFKKSAPLEIDPDWHCGRFIIKPCVSASAMHTTIVTKEEIQDQSYLDRVTDGDWMVQPFLENITEGEISLHYFNRVFSHAVLKVPKVGDFRVQEEHGGTFSAYEPSAELIRLGEEYLSKITVPLLYARVDLIPYAGAFALMELELIEPFLNFAHHPAAPDNFLVALDKLTDE